MTVINHEFTRVWLIYKKDDASIFQRKKKKRHSVYLFLSLNLFGNNFFFFFSMSTSYWDGSLLSPLLIRMSNPLKRARSTESFERALKRSKPFKPKST